MDSFTNEDEIFVLRTEDGNYDNAAILYYVYDILIKPIEKIIKENEEDITRHVNSKKYYLDEIKAYSQHVRACKNEIAEFEELLELEYCKLIKNIENIKTYNYYIGLNKTSIYIYNEAIKDNKLIISNIDKKINYNKENITYYNKRISFYKNFFNKKR